MEQKSHRSYSADHPALPQLLLSFFCVEEWRGEEGPLEKIRPSSLQAMPKLELSHKSLTSAS